MTVAQAEVDAVDPRVDVRLLGGVGAAWLALLVLASRPPAVVAVTAGAAAFVAAANLRSRGRWAPGLAVAAACVVLVSGRLAMAGWSAEHSTLHALAERHAEVTVRLVLGEDAHPLMATNPSGGPRVAVGARARAVLVRSVAQPADDRVLVLAPASGWQDLVPGQTVMASGTVQPSLDGPAAGVTLFAQTPPQVIGGPPWWQAAAARVRGSLQQAADVLPPAERGLLPGLVDGDTTRLDPVLADRFRVAGLTHLVAVSGTNCSIVVGIVVLALRRFGARPAFCAAAGLLVLAAFIVIARPSPSVLRAAVMAAVALWATARGRPRQGLPIVAAATLALMVWQPALAGDAGFAMSVLATAALLLIAPGWAAALRRRRVPAGVAEALAVAAAAHVVTAPVVAALNGTVSLAAIPANVLAEPAVPAATGFGFAAAAVAPLWSAGGAALAWVAGWPCRWLVGVAERAASVPGAVLPWFGGATGALALAGMLVTLWLLARAGGVARLTAVVAVAAAFAQVPLRSVASGWPPPGWRLVACDVGQGDGLVLPAGGRRAVVIDAGPQPVPIDACLRALHVADVALLVLTHFHLDHVGGVLGVLHDRTVGRVLVSPLGEPMGGVQIVRDAVGPGRIPVQQAAVGQRWRFGPLQVSVVAPAAPMHDTRSDPNNSSIVVRAEVNGLSILLPGDAEIEEQDALLHAGVDLSADVLKVPHHGSAYSDPAFLAATTSRVGVISVGLHNDYGHPSPVLLEEMARLGEPVRRTDLDGDVAVVGDEASLTTVVRGPSDPALAAALAPTRLCRAIWSPPDRQVRPVFEMSPPRAGLARVLGAAGSARCPEPLGQLRLAAAAAARAPPLSADGLGGRGCVGCRRRMSGWRPWHSVVAPARVRDLRPGERTREPPPSTTCRTRCRPSSASSVRRSCSRRVR